jgi:predicted nucleotide-binding protein
MFDRLPKEGSPTIIEVLEKHVPNANAVVTLLTPDDEGRKRGDQLPLEPRARQNVLVEAGYAMISRRTRSILVAIGGVTIPTDFEGIHRIQADEWKLKSE